MIGDMQGSLASLFLPHAVHKRRARLISHEALFYYAIFLVLTIGGLKAVSLRLPGVLGYASNINTSDLLKYTNEQREGKGLGALTLNDDLSQAAKAKADDMFEHDYWAHVSPQGVDPWYFFSQAGYDYYYAGENLAKNFSDSRSVVKAWMNSPSHRDNLLNTNYDEIGFAVVNGELDGYETTLVVQLFGKRRFAAPSGQVGGSEGQVAKDVVPAAAKEAVAAEESVPLQVPTQLQVARTQPVIDVTAFTRTVALILGGFIILLYLADLWYSSKMGIVKINGSTIAHTLLLLMVLLSVGFVISPGRVG